MEHSIVADTGFFVDDDMVAWWSQWGAVETNRP